jgi:CRISPR-associated protein Csd2
MSTRELYLFEHDTELGNAHDCDPFKQVVVRRKVEVPRGFHGYEVTGKAEAVRRGFKLFRKVG